MSDIVCGLDEHRGRMVFPFGGGVNSVALYLFLVDAGLEPLKDFFPIFQDHGCDSPETYSYLKKFQKTFPLITMVPIVDGHDNMYDYYMAKQSFPSIQWRDCTHKFKINENKRFVRDYLTRNIEPSQTIMTLIGYDAGEKKRFEGKAKGDNVYPLVELGWDRKRCIEEIEHRGFEAPPKSSCWFCPFQSKTEWDALKHTHPDLYLKAAIMEANCNERRLDEGKSYLPIDGKTPLDLTGYHVVDHKPFMASDFDRVSMMIAKVLVKEFGYDATIRADHQYFKDFFMMATQLFIPDFDPDFEYEERRFLLDKVTMTTMRSQISKMLQFYMASYGRWPAKER